jgi:hypothetical protein
LGTSEPLFPQVNKRENDELFSFSQGLILIGQSLMDDKYSQI